MGWPFWIKRPRLRTVTVCPRLDSGGFTSVDCYVIPLSLALSVSRLMLAPVECSQWTTELLREATPELFDAASTRKGEWVVYRPHANKGPFWCAVSPLSWTSVVFTEKEFSSLYHLIRHGLDTCAKETALMGTLVMEGKRLWPDGSLEHMAMKIVGVEAMSCLLRGQQSPTRQLAWRVCLVGLALIPMMAMRRSRGVWAKAP